MKIMYYVCDSVISIMILDIGSSFYIMHNINATGQWFGLCDRNDKIMQAQNSINRESNL